MEKKNLGHPGLEAAADAATLASGLALPLSIVSQLNRCGCGRFVNPNRPGTAWMAAGEFGEETEYACPACVAKPGFRLIAGNGSTDPRWCGIVPENTPTPEVGAGNGTPSTTEASQALRDEHQTATGEKG